jgi:hypothetical protein
MEQVLLEELVVPPFFNKFYTFCATRKFIDVFTKVSLAPTLSETNPLHDIASYFLKINFNIIFPATPISSKWYLSFRLSESHMHLSFPPHAAQAPP